MKNNTAVQLLSLALVAGFALQAYPQLVPPPPPPPPAETAVSGPTMEQTISSIKQIMEEAGDLTVANVNSPGFERYNFQMTFYFRNVHLGDNCHLQEDSLTRSPDYSSGYRFDIDLSQSDPQKVKVKLETGRQQLADDGTPNPTRYDPQYYDVSVYVPVVAQPVERNNLGFADSGSALVTKLTESNITITYFSTGSSATVPFKKGKSFPNVHVGDQVTIFADKHGVNDIVDTGSSNGSKPIEHVFFETADQETANRIARALIHASALCYKPKPGTETYF